MLEAAKRNAPAAELSLAIESFLKVQFGLDATGTKGGMEFINYAVRRAKEGEDYKIFFDWWRKNGGERKYWSFSKMRENWPAAFMKETSAQPVIHGGNFYA